MDRGLKGKETRGENAGSKSKVQFGEEGWSLKTKQNKINHILLILFYNNGGFPLCSLMFNRGSPPLFLTSSYSSPLVVVTDPLL